MESYSEEQERAAEAGAEMLVILVWSRCSDVFVGKIVKSRINRVMNSDIKSTSPNCAASCRIISVGDELMEDVLVVMIVLIARVNLHLVRATLSCQCSCCSVSHCLAKCT